MFSGDHHGKAAEAIAFYASLFDNSEVLEIDRYGHGEIGPEGTVKTARFTLNGIEFMAIDSAIDHKFNFTPSISMFVDCESKAEIDAVYGALADGGMPLLPLDSYDFSKRFGWVQDRYGVSWQLNLS